jgi:hypothetical protein
LAICRNSAGDLCHRTLIIDHSGWRIIRSISAILGGEPAYAAKSHNELQAVIYLSSN